MICPSEARQILVLALGPIGDTLFATPALRALRKRFPESHITAVLWERSREVLEGNPRPDRILAAGSVLELLSILSRARQQKYDLAVGLSHQGSRFAHLSGARTQAVFPEVGNTLIWPDLPVRRMHVIEHCLAVVRDLGAEGSEETELWLSQKERTAARRFLCEEGIGQAEPFVTIHAGGRFFRAKRWPAASFIDLVRRLQGNLGIRVVIVGGRDEVLLAEHVRSGGGPHTIVACARLSLKETAALIAESRLFIGNDSAPLHVAATVGTPTVALFGPTHPQTFGPRGRGHTTVYKALDCSPCFQFLGSPTQYIVHCMKAHCMSSISVNEVFEAVIGKLIPPGRDSRSDIRPLERGHF